MLKKTIGAVVLMLGIGGAAAGATYAASTHSTATTTTPAATAQTTPTATTGHTCPHMGSSSTSSGTPGI